MPNSFAKGDHVYCVYVKHRGPLIMYPAYVIDFDDTFVAVGDFPDSEPRYTHALKYARVYITRDEAELVWAMLSDDGRTSDATIYGTDR